MIISKIMNNATTTIIADTVSHTKIYYQCPFCWTTTKSYCSKQVGSPFFKNKSRRINIIPTLHNHGNETGTLDNRTTTRTTHCRFSKGEVKIIIDETTIRV